MFFWGEIYDNWVASIKLLRFSLKHLGGDSFNNRNAMGFNLKIRIEPF